MANQKGRKHKAAKKNYYSSYDYVSQKRKRLTRLAKQQPNNTHIQEALKNIREYPKGGKKPNNKLGWVSRQDDVFTTGTLELTGLLPTKKKPFQDILLGQRSILGRHEARAALQVAHIVNKAARKFRHETTFNSKRRKGK